MVTPVDPGSRQLPSARTATHFFIRVVILVFENKGASEILADPYMQNLKTRGAYFTDFRGLFHNSYPNYLAMVGGRLFDVDHRNSDKQVTIRGRDNMIGDRLESADRNWKAYVEDYPAEPRPFLGATSGKLYARKHVPFLSFEALQVDPARATAHIVGVQSSERGNPFARDVAEGTLPEYSFYTPNMWNDAHNKPWPWASKWLRSFLSHGGWAPQDGSDTDDVCFGKGKRCFPAGTLLVITFDESGSRSPDNHIATWFLGDTVQKGAEVTWPTNHYNVLATIEANFGLAPLAEGDALARVVEDIWIR
jgi:hypothetical protein